jgi:hypothetical protein
LVRIEDVVEEVKKVMGRKAVTEAQLKRVVPAGDKEEGPSTKKRRND